MEQINLNIIPDGVMPVCHASQFDKNRTIRFNLKDNGSVYTLAGTETITCKVRKPDDTENTINVANTSSSYVDVTFGLSDTDLSGYAMCELKIVKGTQTIGSRNFLLNIEADAFDGSKFEERSASGAIASFETNYIDNLNELIVNITATQAGSGTPSPSNPRSISGWSSVNVVNTPDSEWTELWDIDNTFGGVVNFNQLVFNVNAASEVYGITRSSVNGGKSLRYTGISTNTTNFTACAILPSILENHVVYLDLKCNLPTGTRISYSTIDKRSTSIIKSSSNINNYGVIINSGVEVDFTVTPQAFDLTQMFGSTIADYIYSLEQNEAGAGVAFFRSLYPNAYYDYDAGTSELVGGDNKVVTTISLGDTYYGGTLNVTTGVLTITHGYVDIGTLNYTYASGCMVSNALVNAGSVGAVNSDNPVICEVYKTKDKRNWASSYSNGECGLSIDGTQLIFKDSNYSDPATFKTDMSGEYVVYELATPTTVQLTPTEVRTLLEDNNIFADTGDIVSCKYLVEVT